MNAIYGFVLCFLLGIVFLLLTRLIGKGAFQDREKGSVYECGFEPMGPTRVSFSIRFFLIAVIFLIFDLEIVLLFPFVFKSNGIDWAFSFRMGIFLFILRVGLIHEMNEGSLDWKD